MIDTASPYIVLDTETYSAFASKLNATGFTCPEYGRCYRENDSECNTTGLSSLGFDALSGVNQKTTTKQKIEPSYYLYADKQDTCNVLVDHGRKLPNSTIILGDPFVLSYVISFNPYLRAVYVAPNKDVLTTMTRGSADAQGIIALVGACIMIVVAVILCGYCCIKDHEMRKKQFALKEERKEEEEDEEAKEAEEALLDSAKRADADE